MVAEGEIAMVAAFEAARPALFGMAYRMLGTRADAEDVLQDVYLRWSEAVRAHQHAAGAKRGLKIRRLADRVAA